ncbi:MAG: GNAT family N-acetyltransferase [Bacteroidota bacterium]|nr:GNAT family N-acetyltransferase [Bacteroidota bacterium]
MNNTITYTAVETDEEIQQILELQKRNLPQNLTPEQVSSQGFVTVIHSFDTLKKMNDTEASIIAKAGDRVIGYLLAMTTEAKADIPVLIPMFTEFDKVVYHHKKISGYNYIVVGQVCIADGWRGQGILDDCYKAYRKHFQSRYDFAITEILQTNKRSLKAHKRIGFESVHIYPDSKGNEWNIVLWDWQNKVDNS